MRKLKRKEYPAPGDYVDAYPMFGPELIECPHCYKWTPRGYVCNRCGRDRSEAIQALGGGE